MIFSLFVVVTHRRLIVTDVSGQTVCPNLHVQDGTDIYSQCTRNYQSTLPNVREEQRSQVQSVGWLDVSIPVPSEFLQPVT